MGCIFHKMAKKKETINGTLKYFLKLVCGSLSEYPIGENYRILFNKNSKEGANKFLLRYVHDTSIEGNIIFINDGKVNIDINDIKEILKRDENQHIFEI